MGKSIANIQAIFSGTAGIFPQIATAMVLYFGVSFVLTKELTTGMVTSFVIPLFVLTTAFLFYKSCSDIGSI